MPISINNNQNILLTQQDTEFITLIQNMITAYGDIAYDVNKKLIIDVIKTCARFFFREGGSFVEQKMFFTILKEDITDFKDATYQNAPNYGNGKAVGFWLQLIPQIRNVIKIYRNNLNPNPNSQELIQNVQLLQRSAPYGQSILGINNQLYIIEAAAKMIEQNTFDSIFGKPVPFDFNPYTQKLHIFESNDGNNITLETLINVDIQTLYRNDLFVNYVYAKCREQLFRVLSSHTYTLPGGATLQPEAICGDFTSHISEIEAKVKASSGIGEMIFFRTS